MFRKMYLTSQLPYDKSPYIAPLRRVDLEMREIMDRTDLDDSDKIRLYNQLLQRYLQLNEQWVSEPAKVTLASSGVSTVAPAVTIPPTPTPPLQPPTPAPRTKIAPVPAPRKLLSTAEIVPKPIEDIVDDVIGKYRGSVRRVLQSGKVKWDDEGRLIYQQEPISGSDIGKLIHGVVTDNKRTRVLSTRQPGWNAITKLIEKRKIRRSFPPTIRRAIPPKAKVVSPTSALSDEYLEGIKSDVATSDEPDEPVRNIGTLWGEDYY
jgi:hypothetical protein